jgi:hypothetical protein
MRVTDGIIVARDPTFEVIECRLCLRKFTWQSATATINWCIPPEMANASESTA